MKEQGKNLRLVRRLRSERGVELIEYVIASGILIVVFVIGGILLRESSENRTDKGMGSVKQPVPCAQGAPGVFGDLDEDACK